MTAQLIDFPSVGAKAEDTIRATVRALMKGKSLNVEAIAPRIGISPGALYRKLAGKGEKDAFKAGEVAGLAKVLGVTVGQLYDGLGGTFSPDGQPSDCGYPVTDLQRYRALRQAAA